MNRAYVCTLFYFFTQAATHTQKNLSVPCMCAFDKTSHMWTFSTCKSNEWNVCLARICEIRRDGDGCTVLPVHSWIKIVGTEAGVCRHTSQTVTLFMHALNLIVTSTTLTPLPPPSVALPCRLHSLCNDVLPPSDEKLITIHSYQREASPHCWHRADCCVCSLHFWGHALEQRREPDVPYLMGEE